MSHDDYCLRLQLTQPTRGVAVTAVLAGCCTNGVENPQ